MLNGTTTGTGVGQVAQGEKDALAAAIAAAQEVYDDRANKTQLQLDEATAALDSAIKQFEGTIIEAGDPATLTTAITEAENLHDNATEGVEVGQHIVGSKADLQAAIDAAQLVLQNAATKTAQQLADAKAALDLAVASFTTNKVTALTGLSNVTITGAATDTSNQLTIDSGETVELSSSDPSNAVAAAAIDADGTIKVTGAAYGGPITITAQVKKDGQVIKTGAFTVTVVPMSITSKRITSLDFSTAAATQAKLMSKPVTVGDFTGNRKDFTIVIGEDRIPIYVSWALSPSFPRGEAMGGVVDSHIQDFYYRKGGTNGIMNRPIEAFGTGDTFQIRAVQPGSASSFTLAGADWSYFFEQSSALGTDADTFKNRIFTISDGAATVTIQLTTNFATINDLVNRINSRLTNAGVKAQAEKVSSTQFKLTSTIFGGNLLIDGVNKTDFFE